MFSNVCMAVWCWNSTPGKSFDVTINNFFLKKISILTTVTLALVWIKHWKQSQNNESELFIDQLCPLSQSRIRCLIAKRNHSHPKRIGLREFLIFFFDLRALATTLMVPLLLPRSSAAFWNNFQISHKLFRMRLQILYEKKHQKNKTE